MSSRRRNQKRPPTVEEIVADLRNSKIPNIVVEGDDDVIIYGRLVDDYLEDHIGICQAGGRPTLLKVYEELSDAEAKGDFRHAPVAFIADKDMWVFRGIPPRYTDIIWTMGYSIENDLYLSARLRNRVRDPDYDDALTSISTWFASKVEEYLSNNPKNKVFNTIEDEIPAEEIALHYNQIVPLNTTTLAPGLNCLNQNHKRVQSIKNYYHLQLRGKLLFQVLVRFLKKPRHGFPGANINDYALYNDAITVPESDKLFFHLKTEVQDKLQKQTQKKIAARTSTP